ncbi:MAG: insulinase family protein [Desulfuromonadales bacterium]
MEEGPFFENLIRKHLLENPHRVTLLLKPDPGRQEREEQETARRLEEIGKTLSEEEREQILRQTRELQAAQEAEEDLSCLPTLEIADIPAEERPVPSEASAVLTHMGAAGHTCQEMAERMAAATGGIRANAAILENPECLDGFGTLVEIRGKALVRNQDRMFEIFSDLFSAADFTDLARLHTVINQVKTNLDNSIPGSGHSYAARGAARGLTAGARLRDEWTGLSQIRFVRKVAALKPEELAETAEKLKTIGSMLLQREGIRCAVTAEKSSFPNIETALAPFLKALPAGEKASAPADVLFAPAPGHNGWASSLPVAYVTRVFRTVPFSHPDASALMVLARLLRAGFLHREIREKGGAYGGMATFDPEAGLFSLLSYRDPQVTRTLEVYRKAATWAAEENFSAEEIKEAILAVFSDLDRPLSPGGKGSREFAYLRQGLTPEMRRQLREGILAIDGEKISEVARRYLLEGWENSAVGVIAGEDALKKANEELGGEALEVERI